MKLAKDDHVVTAYAQRASGPGWANVPLWIVVRDANGRLREECLQPEEQTPTMAALYNIAEAVHHAMRQAVLLRNAKS